MAPSVCLRKEDAPHGDASEPCNHHKNSLLFRAWLQRRPDAAPTQPAHLPRLGWRRVYPAITTVLFFF